MLRSGKGGGYPRFEIGFAVLVAVLVALVAAGLLINERESEAARIEADNDRIAAILSQRVRHDLAMLSESLRTVGHWAASHPVKGPDFHRFLNALAIPFQLTRTIIVADAAGEVVADSRAGEPALGRNIADREYFAWHLRAGGDGIYVGPNVRSRVDGHWSMPISRALRDSTGKPGHVVSMAVDPLEWAADLTRVIDFTPHRYWVTDADGTIVMSRAAEGAGEKLPADDSRHVTRSVAIDPWPFVLTVGLPTDIAEERFIAFRDRTLGVAVALVVVILAGGIHQWRRTRLIVDQRLALQDEMAQRAESENRFRVLFEHAPAGIFLHDGATGRVLEANRRALADNGLDSVDDLNRRDFWHDPPYAFADAMAWIDRAAREGSQQFTWKDRDRQGGTYWRHVTLTPVTVDGRPCVLAISRDITERRRLSEDLRRSQERLGFALQGADDGLWDWNLETDEVYYSPRWMGMLGYGANELPMMLDTWAALVHPDDKAGALEMAARVADGTDSRFEIEFRMRHKDGHWVDVLSRATVAVDGDGNPVVPRRLVGTHVDISERKRAEATIQQQLAFRSAVIENATEGLCVCHDVDEFPFVRFTLWNDRMQAITGFDIEEINAQGWYQSVYPDPRYQELARQRMERMRVGDNLFREEWEITRKDGGKRTLQISTGVLTGGTGAVHVLGLMEDVTARRKAEQDLLAAVRRTEESEARLRSIFNSAGSCIALADGEGRIIEANGTFERLLGYEAGGMVGLHFSRFTHPDDIERELSLVRNLVETGEDQYRLEKRYLTRSGDAVWVDLTITALRDAEGRPRNYVGVAIDTTARKQAEASLSEKSEALLRSNADLQQFAYVSSHDLREPLRMVTSYLELLDRRHGEALDQTARQYIGFAVDGARRMDMLIRDLLAYSRVETQANLFSDFDPREVAGQALDNLRAALEEAGGTVDVGELPAVHADRFQVMRLFQNLIGNAVKYRAPGRVPRIRVEGARDGDKVVFAVVDNGIGIEARYFDRIFVIFQRLHLRDVYEGTGIGLAVCKKIVERHGGHIWVESRPGEGSTFRFTLPAATD